MAKDDGLDGLYFVNCLRGLPIYPLGEKDPAKWVSLRPIVQGRRAAVAEEVEATDPTAAQYIEANAAPESGVEAVSDEPAWAELAREQEADKAGERAA
jgi:hypothetical protein